MPATAFSKHYGKELDVEQLLKLLYGTPDGSVDTTLSDLSPDIRNFIRTDIECPSCFTCGAELVAAGRSKTTGKLVRQACFRFKDSEGGEGHHPFCDFYQEPAKECLSDNLVPFGSPRSEVTRAVGELVCRGVQLGIFDQRRMRDLREWFFNAKLKSQFEVSLDSRVIEWVTILRMTLPYERTVTFNPLYADIPGFDWAAAVRDHLKRQYERVLEGVRTARLMLHDGPTRKRASVLAERYQRQAVFDPLVLRDEYQLTLELCSFLSANYAPLIRCKGKVLPPALLAFSALLLFVSGWSLEKAIEKFVGIIQLQSFDPTAGNFMGLNPFHDYEAWRIIKGLQEAMPLNISTFDVRQLLRDTETELRQQHALWRKDQQ